MSTVNPLGLVCLQRPSSTLTLGPSDSNVGAHRTPPAAGPPVVSAPETGASPTEGPGPFNAAGPVRRKWKPRMKSVMTPWASVFLTTCLLKQEAGLLKACGDPSSLSAVSYLSNRKWSAAEFRNNSKFLGFFKSSVWTEPDVVAFFPGRDQRQFEKFIIRSLQGTTFSLILNATKWALVLALNLPPRQH